ncbi:MAG: YncE family protein [Nitrosopumilaceae archaeon]
MLNNPDVAKGVQLTDSVTNAIKIEKGDISFGAINPQTNAIYLGYRDSNMILAVDIFTKVLTKVPILKPKYIQVNPQTNMVYVITNGTVSIIDGATNKLVKEIDEDAPFAKFLSINPSKNLVYVTYSNASDKSRKKDPIDKLAVFDATTFSKIKETSLGLKEPSGLAVDLQSNLVHVANSKISSISVLDGISLALTDTISVPGEKHGWLANNWQRLDNIVMINNNTKLLYVVGTTGSSGDGGGAEQFCIYVVYLDDKQLVHKLTLDGSASEICSSVVINQQNEKVYVRKPTKNAIQIMDGFAKASMADVELTKVGFFKKMFSDKSDPIIFNPSTSKLYQADGKSGLLLEIDG